MRLVPDSSAPLLLLPPIAFLWVTVAMDEPAGGGRETTAAEMGRDASSATALHLACLPSRDRMETFAPHLMWCPR